MIIARWRVWIGGVAGAICWARYNAGMGKKRGRPATGPNPTRKVTGVPDVEWTRWEAAWRVAGYRSFSSWAKAILGRAARRAIRRGRAARARAEPPAAASQPPTPEPERPPADKRAPLAQVPGEPPAEDQAALQEPAVQPTPEPAQERPTCETCAAFIPKPDSSIGICQQRGEIVRAASREPCWRGEE